MSLQGTRLYPKEYTDLVSIIDQAFDYRGDVTLELKSGESIEGFVFSRNGSVAPPYLELFPTNSSSSQKILYDQIRGVWFSGEDTASGKSWESWVKKKQEEKSHQISNPSS